MCCDLDDRQFALGEAVAYLTGCGPFTPDAVRHAADVVYVAGVFYSWLTAPVYLSVTAAALTFEQGPEPGPGTPTLTKGPTMAQLTDTQQVTLSVAEADSKGNPVSGDTLAWTVDDPTVCTVTPDSTGYTPLVVAGVPGVANITVTDSTVTPALTGTFQITVVPGAAASLVISEGTPEDQPPAV